MKNCNICKKNKELNLFYKNTKGFFNYCIDCHKEKSTKRQVDKIALRNEPMIFLQGEFFTEHFDTGLLCSNYGRIFYINGKNIINRHNHFLKQTKMKNGYFTISFNTKHIYVHRLIAESLIPNFDYEKYTHVNHLDGNKENNNYSNLEWTTHLKNINHAVNNDCYSVKLNREQVIEIRNLKEKKTPQQLAIMFNVSDVNIRLILNRKIWKHI